MTELRDVERELDRFRGRLIAAAVFVLLAFGLLAARLVYLQVLRHDELATQAEANRIAVVPIVPNRGLIVDRNGVVLATNYSAYTLEITPSRMPAAGRARAADRRAGADGRDRPARPPPLQAAAGRGQELRVAADPHQAQRRGGGALHRAALPLPGRRRQGAAVPQLPAGRDRQPPAGLHRPHQPGREEGHGRLVRRGPGQLQGHRIHRQAGPGAELRARAARHHRLRGGRDQRRRPRRAAAEQPRRRRRATRWCCRSTSSCRRWSKRCSATAAARWWRSTRATARCWPSSASPPSTPTCSSTASTSRAGAS